MQKLGVMFDPLALQVFIEVKQDTGYRKESVTAACKNWLRKHASTGATRNDPSRLALSTEAATMSGMLQSSSVQSSIRNLFKPHQTNSSTEKQSPGLPKIASVQSGLTIDQSVDMDSIQIASPVAQKKTINASKFNI